VVKHNPPWLLEQAYLFMLATNSGGATCERWEGF
jgi:hypothetical protein